MIVVAINSAGAIPATLLEAMVTVSRWCLVIAIAGLGMKSSFLIVRGSTCRVFQENDKWIYDPCVDGFRYIHLAAGRLCHS